MSATNENSSDGLSSGRDVNTSCAAGLRRLLELAVDRQASDLHLVAGRQPVVRVHGSLTEVETTVAPESSLREDLESVLSEHNRSRFRESKNIDFSLAIDMDGAVQRFRVNYFYSGRAIGACFRIIPREIPAFDWAGFPVEVADRLGGYHNGLILFSGVTGSGKTTSLAMIINRINRRGGARIITVEEPVEYVFSKEAGSLVTQREVGVDVENFSDGLKYGLRQDPDVILVGEIRDQETAKMALSAAETGHLVFSTLHTRDAKGAISRYADLFPQEVQTGICSQLAMSLRAVISQHLLPNAVDGDKRVLALEVMYNNLPVAAAIRMGRIESIDNSILTGRADGMVTLNESLRHLMQTGQITRATATRFSTDPERLDR
ncbi:MAG: PilT/PilU family type 4a pilus ATPase [Pirellulaceae bacterium]|jgi:twitching motility protein PilT|nr:PilT/PilU family type 4a pilus ATPase [Pirellulaceae bacterium]MDP7020132.1 PilT/PilU family type 4a pilus ATPase [Pirellulaceae bacterium]